MPENQQQSNSKLYKLKCYYFFAVSSCSALIAGAAISANPPIPFNGLLAARKKVFALLATGLLSAMISGTVFAVSGEPLQFDQFTATSGTITAACDNWVNPNGEAINVTCGPETISDGMLQREVYVSSLDPQYNGTYIQFLMIEEGASGDATANPFTTARGSLNFINEDFVKMNNRGDGLASKLTIVESKFDDTTFIEDRFSTSIQYNVGWARGSGLDDVWVDIDQNESSIQYDNTKLLATTATELFDETVSIKALDGNLVNNSRIEISQRMDLADASTGTASINQKFKHIRVGGFFNNPASYAFGGIIDANPVLPGGTNGGVLDWDVFEVVAGTWIGFVMTDPAIDLIFGLTRFENLSDFTGNILTTLLSFDTPEAAGSIGQWEATKNYLGDPLFGSVEAMADPAPSITMTDFSVLTPVKLLGVLNPDYIANSSPTLPPETLNDFQPVDADYNNWTVASGIFAGVTCPPVADYCETPSRNEDGLYQRKIVVNGVAYYHTIVVADGTVTGDPSLANFAVNSIAFANETFVRADNSISSGIAARLHLAERGTNTAYLPTNTNLFDMPTDAGDFVTDVRMNYGWANRGIIDIGGGVYEPDAVIAINQSLLVPDNFAIEATSWEQVFTMERGASEADKRQTLFDRVGTSVGFAQPVNFESVTVTGAYQTTESLAGNPFTMVGDGTILSPTGPQLTWAAGDALRATWVGGEYGVPAGVAVVGTTSFTNLTSGDRAAYTSAGLAGQGPEPDASSAPDASWIVDPFGPAPVYP